MNTRRMQRTDDRNALSRPASTFLLASSSVLLACVSLFLAGCDRSDEVVTYTVPKQEQLAHSASASMPMMPPHGMGQPAQPNQPRRMLAAMIRHGDDTWFFKAVGPVDALAKQADAFVQFVQSVRFSEETGEPTWRLPKGWQRVEQSGPSMRFATVKVPTEQGPVDLSVIPLRTPPGDYDQYVLANVNRWRGQLGLAPISANQLTSETTKVTTAEGEAIVVNLVSPSGGPKAPSGGPAGLPAGHPPIGGGAAPTPAGQTTASTGTKPKISFEAPEHWKPAPAVTFSVLAFQVQDGDKKAQVTVTPAGGDLLSNVNRWRRQVGLSAISAEQLRQSSEPIEVSGASGTYVRLVGQSESILGVVVTVKGQTWFVKLKGDKNLAAKEEAAFRKFVQSLKL